MVLTVIRNDRLFSSTLPPEVRGKHWVNDIDEQGEKRALTSIEAIDGIWTMCPCEGVELVMSNGEPVESVPLHHDEGLYRLRRKGEQFISLLVEKPGPSDKTFTKLGFKNDTVISIGRSPDCSFVLASPFVSSRHALLRLVGQEFTVIDTKSANGVFVNGQVIAKGGAVPLKVGDVIYILGLKIMVGKQFIAFNNPGGRLTVNKDLVQVPYAVQKLESQSEDSQITFETDYFYRSPRIKRSVEHKEFDIEEPPAATVEEDTPAIVRIGPSLGMALASVMMGLFMVTNMMGGSGSPLRALPMIGMMVTMVLGAVLWPNLSKSYNTKKAAEKEAKRRVTYAAYLDKVRSELLAESALQAEILMENRISVGECFERVIARDRRLFERTGMQDDFLELRIGMGDVELDAAVKWPQDKLSLEEDALKMRVLEFSRIPQIVQGVPLALSLVEDFATGIVGDRADAFAFLRGLVVQIVALHAPNEVKIVLFGNGEERPEWEFMCALPHVFDDAFASRFIATSNDEASEVSLRIERELQQRRESQKVDVVTDYGIYYVVLVTNHSLASKVDCIKSINSQRKNLGFSTLTLAGDIRNLPKECTRIIDLGTRCAGQENQVAQLFNPNDATGSQKTFSPDIFVRMDQADTLTAALADIEMDTAQGSAKLAKSVGFLEMFEAAKVEHLNVVSRWQENNPCVSLATPVGIDTGGGHFLLNIHEDYHGPHGLIAGMTGSGKSEFIICYILSLAVNYRPDELSFVLIDYKGGGLAGAFDNEKARLPHLAGTITNLDGAAINRSLISIQSELRRRQDAFNQARDVAGLGTMDIYKYQELRRQGVVNDPIPHLLIISDEFAELKSQQPEFMDQLISAARIGRSLGVHLILATQKPSGVVNDQIWSNARFKVCLKVAEAADSREMLKRPDAAELVDAGRFYLQVGYNEYFALGQSAYAGTKYRALERFVKKKDNSVVLISNTGRGLLSTKPEMRGEATGSTMPESVAILDHLVAVSEDLKLKAPALWLEPIPALITSDSLLEKYSQEGGLSLGDSGVLEPIIGELDDPYNQQQLPLSLPLTVEGNVLIYGSTGSGKATLVSSMLYTLLKTHSPRTFNAYLLDFGAETLGAFREAPHVGDVVFATDAERIERLFRMLVDELERRRKILSVYDGGFVAYTQQNNPPEPLPSILVVIHGFEIFTELFEKQLDGLAGLTRDGLRCGISFVLTCTRANGVSYRLLPNFKQKLALKLNSNDDYLSILGSMRNVVIPHDYARGLVKLDKIYEFQGAQASVDGRESETIRALCHKLALQVAKTGPQAYRAWSIPALPEVVTAASLTDTIDFAQQVPLGFAKDSIEVATFDFKRTPVLMVLGEDEMLEARFLAGLIEVLRRAEKVPTIILDPDSLLKDSIDRYNEKYESSAGNPVAYFASRADVTGFLGDVFEGNRVIEGSFLIGVSLKSIVESLDSTLKTGFEQFVTTGAYRHLRGLVLSGEPSRFSSFGFEAWYRELASFGDGVWVGDGFGNQNTLKTGRILPLFREQLKKDFGFLVFKGNATLIKHVVADEDQ
jgi:S-DNA-T family DNA segregation ATPase FtsK/SpoIIIE